MLVCTLVALINLVITLGGSTRVVYVGEIFRLGWNSETVVSLGVYLDFYSAYIVWVVFTISFLVHLYSTVYMGGGSPRSDHHDSRKDATPYITLTDASK